MKQQQQQTRVMVKKFDEEEFEQRWAKSQAEQDHRNAIEAALDDVSEFPSALVTKVARRLLAACAEYELFDVCDENFREVALRKFGIAMHIPYVELAIAAHTAMSDPDVRRDDLGDWVEWCQQHAPERLAVQKEKKA
jgi:hypothetical protein